jgi:chemotaxis receptor (MCP) glutamine deamidase CheD
MKQTAVEWLINELNKVGFNLENLDLNVFEQAKEMEKQQKIAYKISTPLGHVSHCIEKYGIEIAISEYKCKLVNNKESEFWNDCLKIAKLYNEKFNKNEK